MGTRGFPLDQIRAAGLNSDFLFFLSHSFLPYWFCPQCYYYCSTKAKAGLCGIDTKFPKWYCFLWTPTYTGRIVPRQGSDRP